MTKLAIGLSFFGGYPHFSVQMLTRNSTDLDKRGGGRRNMGVYVSIVLKRGQFSCPLLPQCPPLSVSHYCYNQ